MNEFIKTKYKGFLAKFGTGEQGLIIQGSPQVFWKWIEDALKDAYLQGKAEAEKVKEKDK